MTTDEGPLLLAGLAARVMGHLDDLEPLVMAAIGDELPELVADASLQASLRATVSQNLASALMVLLHPDEHAAEAPLAALDHARRLAQRGIPLTTLLRAYRLGQAAFQRHMIAEISRAGLTAEEVAVAAMQISSVAFGYIDRTSESIVTTYQTERDFWISQRIAATSAKIDALLLNEQVDVAEAERALGYPLGRIHRAAVIWREPGATERSSLERLATGLAAAAGCTAAPLVLTRDVSTTWAWLPSPTRSPALALPDGVRVAMGTSRHGVDGFRVSTSEALGAQRVAVAAAADCQLDITTAADVGPLALMCDDMDRLRGWVRGTLGPLAAADEVAARFRGTLEMFLSTGGNFVQTGRLLSLHRNTVHYRITKAEKLLGGDVAHRRLVLELALLACRMLGAPVLSDAAT